MESKSLNGRLYTCNSCHKIHMEYGNFGIDLKSQKALKEFSDYLKTVQTNQFKEKSSRRKILIPFSNITIKLLLSDKEISELIGLISSFLKKQKTSHQKETETLDAITYLNVIILN